MPRQGNNSTIEEKHLAARLIKARTAGLLSSEQEVALGHLAQGAAKSRQQKYYQKNKARIVAKQKEYDAQRRATPHGKAKLKEYYQKNKARIAAYQKEYMRKYQASPQGKAKRKDWDAKRRATPHRMATLHGKETTSGRLRAERGELLHCGKRKR